MPWTTELLTKEEKDKLKKRLIAFAKDLGFKIDERGEELHLWLVEYKYEKEKKVSKISAQKKDNRSISVQNGI